MPGSAEPTHAGYRFVVDDKRKQRHVCTSEEDAVSFVQAMIVSTCGNLFRGMNLMSMPAFERLWHTVRGVHTVELWTRPSWPKRQVQRWLCCNAGR